jgi:hypothetical protein
MIPYLVCFSDERPARLSFHCQDVWVGAHQRVYFKTPRRDQMPVAETASAMFKIGLQMHQKHCFFALNWLWMGRDYSFRIDHSSEPGANAFLPLVCK